MTDRTESNVPKKSPLSLQMDLSKFTLATEEEKAQQEVMSESTTFFKDGMRKLLKNPLAVGSIIVLILIISAAVVGPMIIPYGYEEMIQVNGRRDKTAKNLGPMEWSKNEQKAIDSGEKLFPHLLGTDEQCRDYLVRILYGTRVSLFVGFFAAILVLIIGLIYGSISGYAGGKVDMVMMRIVDAMYSIPDMLYIILITVVLEPSMGSILLGICISSWMGMARQVRAQVMTLKEQEFSLAAFVLGASKKRILFKHLIINSMGPIIVSVTLLVPSAIFNEAFLGFLGIGVPAPNASWGTLANDAKRFMTTQPMQVIWPTLAICLTMLALNFIGDGLGDALDPKKK